MSSLLAPRRLGLGLAALGCAGLVAVAAPSAQEGGRPLNASLSGAAEVPGPGDPDGAGVFQARVNPGQAQVCYELSVRDIAAPTAAHIHRGAAGEAGPPVVTLGAPTGGVSSGCVPVERQLAQDLIQNPSGFYVNVHNAEFPPGAVRGQLSK